MSYGVGARGHRLAFPGYPTGLRALCLRIPRVAPIDYDLRPVSTGGPFAAIRADRAAEKLLVCPRITSGAPEGRF